jgi:regulator of cell morphogenesis and NO signaling
MKIDPHSPISTLAADIPGARSIFEDVGIDYACAGNRSLEDAAHEMGVDLDRVVTSIRGIAVPGSKAAWSDAPLTDLVNFVERGHHQFLKEQLQVVVRRLFGLCVPSAQPSEDLRSLRAAMGRLSDMLQRHIDREERDLFPAIAALEERTPPECNALRARIGNTITEHGTISVQLRTIRGLRLRLQRSGELSPSTAAVLNAIANLEAHLHEFMFLENHFLFPRAVADM